MPCKASLLNFQHPCVPSSVLGSFLVLSFHCEFHVRAVLVTYPSGLLNLCRPIHFLVLSFISCSISCCVSATLYFEFFCITKSTECSLGTCKYTPVTSSSVPQSKAGHQNLYVRLSGTGRNLVRTCEPSTWLVHGTSSFLIEKKTKTFENWNYSGIKVYCIVMKANLLLDKIRSNIHILHLF